MQQYCHVPEYHRRIQLTKAQLAARRGHSCQKDISSRITIDCQHRHHAAPSWPGGACLVCDMLAEAQALQDGTTHWSWTSSAVLTRLKVGSGNEASHTGTVSRLWPIFHMDMATLQRHDKYSYLKSAVMLASLYASDRMHAFTCQPAAESKLSLKRQ